MSDGWLQQDGGRVLLTLHVQPNAKRSGFAGRHGEAMKLRLAAPPVDGKANAALCAFLADFCEVPKRAVSLVGGASSRHKRVCLEGVGEGALTRLQALDNLPA